MSPSTRKPAGAVARYWAEVETEHSAGAWGEEHAARPSDLGMRVTYIAGSPPDETAGPDCDFAVPLEP
jgi:hypothetical protein